MKITKYEHACVVLEKNNQRIVIDPGVYTHDLPTKLENVVGIIVTHEHSDHFDVEKLSLIVKDNPKAKVFALEQVVSKLVKDIPSQTVRSGDKISIDGFAVEFFGGLHAEIAPGYQIIGNLGVIIDDTFVYPGDSFAHPRKALRVLAIPASAPWLKTSESMEYIENTYPQIVFPTHNALLSPVGQELADGWLMRACEKVGAQYKPLEPGQSIEI